MKVNALIEGTMSLLIQHNWMINDYRLFEIHWRILSKFGVFKTIYLSSSTQKTGEKRKEPDEHKAKDPVINTRLPVYRRQTIAI